MPPSDNEKSSEVIKLLLAEGADAKAKDNSGRAAFDFIKLKEQDSSTKSEAWRLLNDALHQ